MKVSIGRVVHYQPRGDRNQRPQAAIVVDTDPDQGFRSESGHEENETGVYLAVLTRSCATFPGIVRYHPDAAPGTWRWPPREAPHAPRATLLPPPPVLLGDEPLRVNAPPVGSR